MTDFGDELRRLLAGRGISLSAAARAAGCSKGYLSNAANGRKPLTPRVAAGLDRLFDTGGTFATYALLASPASTARPGVRSPHAASTPAGEPEDADKQERLGHTLAHPADADLVAVAYLREQIRRLDEQYDHTPAAALIAETGQCLGQIGFLRTHAGRTDVRRDLCAAHAEAGILMGQLVWDASQRRDQAAALTCYEQAAAAARSRADRAAEGLALLRISMVTLYGHKDPHAGLAACQHTAQVAATASNVITGLALLHTAEAHAMLGERRSCELALAAADRQFGQISLDDPATGLFSQAQPGRMAGSCYLFLGDPRRAASVLEQTALQFRDRSKAEAIVHGNLALALIGLSRADEAAAALHKALDVIEATWSGGGLNIVFSAVRQLSRWQQLNTVREVSDRLLGLMAAS